MNEILGSVWWLIVSLGVLVTFHEFGHYWVARRCGVRVLRFSVGFGRALWSRRGRDGVEYVVAAIPLGGYVKMLDEREGPVPVEAQAEAFNRQPVLRRMAIVAAGPIANLLLCVAFLWLMFVIGRPDFAPVVGHSEGLAAQAGLERGDTVTAIDGRPTPTWTDVQMALIPTALDRRDVPVRIERADGGEAIRTLTLSRLPASIDERRVLAAIGLAGRHDLVPARVGRVEPGTPAAGLLREGDRITAIDGVAITSWTDIPVLVQRLGERGGTAMVEVERDGERLALELAPRRLERESGETAWVLGIAAAQPAPPERDAVLRYGPIDAVPAALRETAHQASELVAMIGRASGHDRTRRERLRRPGRRVVPVAAGHAVAEPGHPQPAADPDLGRRSPAVLPYRAGQRLAGQRAGHGRRPVRRAGADRRSDGARVLQRHRQQPGALTPPRRGSLPTPTRPM
jgi:regulator of sigma E protease